MIDEKKVFKKIVLAYFSGTGGTKVVCDCFEEQLLELGTNVTKVNMATCKQMDVKNCDLHIIFSPVYAFRLSPIVETWVKNLPEGKKRSAVIISVSGGGEVSPNTACRNYCKKVLKTKGYNLIYEKMLVMPSNFAIQAEEDLNFGLLEVLPFKVKYIIQEILSGKKRITTPKLQDRFLSVLGKAEHVGARFFGASIHASHKCNKCGLCVRNCPQKNIRMSNGVPKFGFRCIWCMKCIYNCPCKALSPRILKFSVLKSGFNIKKMSESAKKESNKKEYVCSKNVLWQGVIDYLCQDDVKF